MVKLKKGSAAAKAWGRKMKRLRAARKPKSKRSSTLKRRKSIKYKRAKPRMAKKKRKSYRKSASVWGINTSKAAAAGIYGAGRSRMSTLLSPYTSMLPAGAISDEVGMIVALQLLKKMVFKKAGVMREAATAGQAIEFARIGEALAMGQINLGGLSPQQTNSGNLF